MSLSFLFLMQKTKKQVKTEKRRLPELIVCYVCYVRRPPNP